MAKNKKEEEPIKGEDPIEEIDSLKKKIGDDEYAKLREQARKEVLSDIQRGALSVPRKVFREGAKSCLLPIKAMVAFNKLNSVTPNENDLPPGSNDLVELDCDERMFVNGKELFGKVIVKQHEAESLKHMIMQKKIADHESTIGRNFLSRKLATGAIQITEVQDVQSELNKAMGRKG